ncbi:hypothetical protein AVEN_70735-1 [Araneus ventricosus]|uniref:Uncharacterized protein n=1 Tax=Araneus ventricosus TaxID=182803 RepID=A0A4Y2KKN0_ARAVE|nr:hypothetical protein AVEN_70735-1 [Araneus ventricosus]
MQITEVGIYQRGIQTFATFPAIPPKECYDAFLQPTKRASLAKRLVKISRGQNARNKSRTRSAEILTLIFINHLISKNLSDLLSFSPSSLLKLSLPDPKGVAEKSISVICPASNHILQLQTSTSLPGSSLESVET